MIAPDWGADVTIASPAAYRADGPESPYVPRSPVWRPQSRVVSWELIACALCPRDVTLTPGLKSSAGA